jgi:Cu/Ag efflux protein CusF
MNTLLKLVRPALALAAVVAASLGPTGAMAQTTMDHSNMDHSKMAATKAGQAKDITDGLVRKVNKETGKVTIQHGEIQHLGMPAMTMAFPVKTPGLLDSVQTGDKIKFKVVKENGRLVITELRPAK